jgi:hypothetical protein
MRDPFIIGLTGRAGAGKDTVAHYLVERYGFAQLSFAEPLREMLCALLEHAGIDHAYVTEPALKAQLIPGLGVSARTLMQTLGTEWGRQLIASDLWVRLLELNAGMPHGPVHDRLVISDVRFLNEAAWVVQHGGVVCGINREMEMPTGPLHESEANLAAICGATLDNSGTLGQLHGRIDSLCLQLELDARA